MKSSRSNWLGSLASEIDFYQRSGRARRTDEEFEWRAYERPLARDAPLTIDRAKARA